MPKVVVITDTSCLIALTKLDLLHILHAMYEQIVISDEIANEFGEPLPEWITVMSVANKKYQQLLESTLDKGEASAIALAMDFEDVLLVMDDLKGRKEVQRLGLKLTGTLGVLAKAKQQGVVDALKPYLDKLDNEGFRVAPNIRQELLRISKEA